ncbi:beta-lactamase domain-containing protein 2-like [Tubulanus polymorphus]|uniref:beta-lactamase domain-containing protein 2-like n=1 Tax=Tubulanus polymorphus TaxID=672921 RepID=UPI003DA44C76
MFLKFTSTMTRFLCWRRQPSVPLHLDGSVNPGFENVIQVFRSMIQDGRMSGGSFAVYHRDELVVDLWGGYADVQHGTKWRRNSIAITQSTTKAVAAICIGILVSRGEMAYDEKVATYWPEFGTNGKEDITVRMLLEHKAGLATLDETITLEKFVQDPEAVNKLLERQKPLWPPGTKQGYHAVTYGMYVGTLVKMVDKQHRDIGTFFRDEVAIPHDVDFWIGLPASEFQRKVNFWNHHPLFAMHDLISSGNMKMIGFFLNPGSLIHKATRGSIKDVNEPGALNNQDLLKIPLTSLMGFGNARSLATVMNLVTSQRLVTDDVLDEFTRPRQAVYDHVVGMETAMAAGMMQRLNPKGELMYGHPGYGGQEVNRDPNNDLTFAFVTSDNRFFMPNCDPRMKALLGSLYDCLEKLETT